MTQILNVFLSLSFTINAERVYSESFSKIYPGVSSRCLQNNVVSLSFARKSIWNSRRDANVVHGRVGATTSFQFFFSYSPFFFFTRWIFMLWSEVFFFVSKNFNWVRMLSYWVLTNLTRKKKKSDGGYLDVDGPSENVV